MPCGEDYFLSEREKNEKVSGKFLYAVTDFSIFKKDEAYWLEYIGNDTYVGRSDNILNQKVEIAPRYLVWYFSEKPRSAFEKVLADWFYGMRTWGFDVDDVGCEAFCDSQAHKAAKRLLMYAPTLNDDTLSEEPDKSLEEEYKDYVENDPVYSKLVNGIAGRSIARHFAEWQKEQDLAEMAQSKSPLSVAYANRCFENGKQAMKEQMLKDAVEGEVMTNGFYPYEPRIVAPYPNCPYDLGDKVKVIVLKAEEE